MPGHRTFGHRQRTTPRRSVGDRLARASSRRATWGALSIGGAHTVKTTTNRNPTPKRRKSEAIAEGHVGALARWWWLGDRLACYPLWRAIGPCRGKEPKVCRLSAGGEWIRKFSSAISDRERDRKFADSPLEGTGFELIVPPYPTQQRLGGQAEFRLALSFFSRE
jgi:hypothetical protein